MKDGIAQLELLRQDVASYVDSKSFGVFAPE